MTQANCGITPSLTFNSLVLLPVGMFGSAFYDCCWFVLIAFAFLESRQGYIKKFE